MEQMVEKELMATNDNGWISLQEASDFLGVTTSTVRRWGDIGRLTMRRTLGGHRRFLRSELQKLAHEEQMVAAPPLSEPTPAPDLSTYSHELLRQEWHMRLVDGAATGRMRGLGQRLLGLLIQYSNSPTDQQRFLDEAHAVGADYGMQAQQSHISMHDMVAAFLFFRQSFSRLAVPLPGIAHPTDLAEAGALRARIDTFMDTTLLGAIGGYEQQALCRVERQA